MVMVQVTRPERERKAVGNLSPAARLSLWQTPEHQGLSWRGFDPSSGILALTLMARCLTCVSVT